MKAATLYRETINRRHYRVVRRAKTETIQIWVDLPIGESAGFPECFYSGDLEGARKYWVRKIASQK